MPSPLARPPADLGWSFPLPYHLYEQTVYILARLLRCAGSPKPLLFAYANGAFSIMQLIHSFDQLWWQYSEPSLQLQHLFPKTLPLIWICYCKEYLTLVLLNKLRCHAFFLFSANQISWSELLLQIHILNGKQCRSRSVGFFRSQLIWIYTICKGRIYPGSAGQGLMSRLICKKGIILFLFPQRT